MHGLIHTLDPARVKPFEENPRKRFRGIKQLAESIRLVGQITPIIVTGCGEEGYDAELVDGERRLRACLAGKMPVRAIFEENGQAAGRYVRSVAANFCRRSHDAVEIMEAVLALRGEGRSIAEIAGIFGKTESWGVQYGMLRKLVSEVLEALKLPGDGEDQTRAQRRQGGKMTLSLALLLTTMSPRLQVKAMRGVLAGRMSLAEARTFLAKMAASKGVTVGKRMSPGAKFRAVSSAVANCYHVVERYLRMPGVQIAALVRGAPRDERKRLAAQLESLCESLLLLSDELDRTGN